MSDLSIVIVSYNTCEMLRSCLNALPAAAGNLVTDVWVVDNCSTDGSQAMIEQEFPAIHLIINSENSGFAKANNQALQQCTGKYRLILNPDTEPEPGSLAILTEYLANHPDVGAVGPKLLNSDGSLQRNGRPFPTPWHEFQGHFRLRRIDRWFFRKIHEYGRDNFDIEWDSDHVSGACLMMPSAVMNQIGLLDESFFMFYEEVEWCWRVHNAGYRVMYVPRSRVVHHWMGSVRSKPREMQRQILQSCLLYYSKTAGPGYQASARVVVFLASLRGSYIRMGVAVKSALRRLKIIR